MIKFKREVKTKNTYENNIIVEKESKIELEIKEKKEYKNISVDSLLESVFKKLPTGMKVTLLIILFVLVLYINL